MSPTDSPILECYGAYAAAPDKTPKHRNHPRQSYRHYHQWSRPGVQKYHQPGHCYRRWYGHGLPRQGNRAGQHGVLQFHPTSLYNPAGENPSFLISEAVGGFGAVLRTKEEKSLCTEVRPPQIAGTKRYRGPRHRQRNEDQVLSTCTSIVPILDKEAFYHHFPNIYDKCMSLGIDPMKDYIPVVACHYICGGIPVITMAGHPFATSMQPVRMHQYGPSTVPTALLPNSCLRGLVHGKRIAEVLSSEIDNMHFQDNIPKWNAEGTTSHVKWSSYTESQRTQRDHVELCGHCANRCATQTCPDFSFCSTPKLKSCTTPPVISPQLCELKPDYHRLPHSQGSPNEEKESRPFYYNTELSREFDYVQNTLM